jgi:hypothetical protein
MRVTVIPSDHWVRRDDDTAKLPEWPFDDANIHAIQWYGTQGEIEYDGQPKPPNEAFTDSAILQPYLTALDAYLEETVLVRARNEDGTYIADDPSTPDVNEAYVEVPLGEA